MRRPIQPGFVVVLVHPAFQGLVKIARQPWRGKSRPARRQKRKDARRGFAVAHREWVKDAAAVERRLRQHFAKRRVPGRPGCFRVAVDEAVRALKATGGRARNARNFLRFQPALRKKRAAFDLPSAAR